MASVMGQVPFTLGMDVCGVVDAAGEGARGHGSVAAVVAMTNQSFGGMAEWAIATQTSVFDAPVSLDDIGSRRVHAALPHRIPRAPHPSEAPGR